MNNPSSLLPACTPACLSAYLLQLSVCSYVCPCVDSKSLCMGGLCSWQTMLNMRRDCRGPGCAGRQSGHLVNLVGLGAKGTVLTCHVATQHDNAAMLDVLLFHCPALVIEDLY